MERTVEIILAQAQYDAIKGGWPCHILKLPSVNGEELYASGTKIDDRFYKIDKANEFIYWTDSNKIPKEISAIFNIDIEVINKLPGRVRFWRRLTILIPIIVAVITTFGPLIYEKYLSGSSLYHPPPLPFSEYYKQNEITEAVNFYTVKYFGCSSLLKKFRFVLNPRFLQHLGNKQLIAVAYRDYSEHSPDYVPYKINPKVVFSGPYEIKIPTTENQEIIIPLDSLSFESGDPIRAAIFYIDPQIAATASKQATIGDLENLGGKLLTWREQTADVIEYKSNLAYLQEIFWGSSKENREKFLSVISENKEK